MVAVKVETWLGESVPLPLPPSLRLLEMVVAIPVVMVLPSEVKVAKTVDTLLDACSPSVLLPAVP